MKRERKGDEVSISSIRNTNKVVFSELEQIFEVCRKHCHRLSTSKSLPSYDKALFGSVTKEVKSWLNKDDQDEFLKEPFNYLEIEIGISKLHTG